MSNTSEFSLEEIETLSVFKANPKLLYKLKLNTVEGNFYEAHQLYKTLHFRAVTAQNLTEALDIIFNGITFFYTKKSDNVYYCSDLSKVFIETLKKLANQEPKLITPELLERIRIIHLALANGNEERNEFSCTILKWSGTLFDVLKSKTTPNLLDADQNLLTYQRTFGHVGIHRQFAMNLWHEENYVQSRYHFLHSTDGESFARMLIECHLNYGFPSEADLFLAQNVLQFLCLRNFRTARQFHDAYLKIHPALATADLHQFPLLNFLKFLFISIQHDQVKWFKAICEVYKPSWQVDASFGDYLERVGQYFFNLQSKKVEKDSIFNNLFKMLSGGGPDQRQTKRQEEQKPGASSRLDVEEEETLEDNDLLD